MRSTLLRYGGALLALAVATVARQFLDPVLGDAVPYPVYFVAVLLVAWFGGLGPAVGTLIAAALLGAYLFIPPRGSLSLADVHHWVTLGFFVLAGGAVIGLAESLRASRAQARTSEQHFRILLEAGNVGVGLVTENGAIEYANPALLRMLGYSAEEVAAGQLRWDRITAPEFADVTPQVIREIRATGAKALPYAPYEKEYIAKDGRRVPVLVSLVPFELNMDGTGRGAMFVTDLTAVKQAEATLRQTNRTLNDSIRSAPLAVTAIDRELRVTLWNPAAERLFGWRSDEVMGQPFPGIPEERKDVSRAMMEEDLHGMVRAGVEKQYVRKDGTRFDARTWTAPLRDADDGIVGVMAIFEDITAPVQAREEARQSRELLERVFESTHVMLAYLDRDFNFLRVNRAYAAADGREPDFFIGKNHFALYPNAENEAIFRRVVETGEPYRVRAKPFVYPEHPERGVSYWDWQIEPVKDALGRTESIVFSLMDVTEPTRVRQELERATEYARTLIETSPDPLVVIGLDARVKDVNKAAEEVIGVPREELIGTGFDRYTAEPERAWAGFRQVLAQGAVRDYPLVLRHASGRELDMLLHGAVYRDAAGEAQGVLVVGRDVTERKRAEELLRRREAELKEAQRIAHLGSWEWNKETDTVTWSDEMYRLFGMDPAQLAPSWADHARLFAPESFRRLMTAVERCLQTGEPYELDLEVICPDRRKCWIIGRGEIWRDAGGRILGVRGTAQDITERKQAEAERERLLHRLAEADRRKDEFLATLAHELRNPLAPISNAFALIRRAADKPAVIGQALDMGERQVGLLVRLVDDLIDIARITRGTIVLRKERVTLEAIVQSALEVSRPQIEAGGHRLTVDLPGEPVWLEADLARVAQAIANLLINAAKYTDTGGHIRISARREGGEAVVAVQDNGLGIPEAMLPEIFDLFTQGAQPLHHIWRGLGVGLPLVKSLVELHGGYVEAASAGPGRGSTFTIRLPCGIALPEAESPGAVPESAAAAPSAQTRRVLVVDDDQDVANSMSMLLSTYGHEVRTVYDGRAALEAAVAFRPDVVLLDIGMPGMDGYEVARRLRRLPELEGLRIIALTGWGQEEDRRRSREAGFDRHLVKPVDPDMLTEALTGAAVGDAADKGRH